MNYYISDLHFGCQNKHDGRTLNHDKIIKENWNKTITNGDTVYILGDIGREGNNKDNEYLCEIISTLKGKKVLIQGNHEKLKDIRLRQLFNEAYNSRIDIASLIKEYLGINPLQKYEKEWLLAFLFIPSITHVNDEIKDINLLFKCRNRLTSVESFANLLTEEETSEESN